jgi:Uma2 family endonuclease
MNHELGSNLMSATVVKQPRKMPVPWLENGDHLSRQEFERLYEQTPEKTKAELINGVVYMASPVRMDFHADQDSLLQTWLGNYRMLTPGVKTATNGSMRIDNWNEPQPDAVLYLPRKLGGLAAIDAEGFLVGVPEFVAEVANTSKSLDLNSKKQTYEKHGVPEYLVWRVQDQAIDWFTLKDGCYHPLAADAAGVYRSQVFPGLWLNTSAMLEGNLPAVYATLQEGCTTAEHQEYVERLKRHADGSPSSA